MDMNGRRKRIFGGIAAHLYAQAVTIITQLTSVPIFLSFVSLEDYGRWVWLSALPIYVGIADFGVGGAAANAITMLRAAGEEERARSMYSSAQYLFAIILPVITLVSAVLIWIFRRQLDGSLSVLVPLIIASVLTLLGGLLDTAYRSTGRYPRVTVLLTSARVVEWVGSIVGLAIQRDIAGAASGFLAGRVVAMILLFLIARVELPGKVFGFLHASRADMTALLKTGLSMSAFPLGTVLSLQGVILIMGIAVGPALLALFASMRTLTRMVTQMALITAKATAPELAVLVGEGNAGSAIHLLERTTRAVMMLVVPTALLMAFGSADLLRMWSGGKLAVDKGAFFALTLSAVISAYWQLRSNLIVSTNQHGSLASALVISTVFGLFLCGLIAPSTGLTGGALAVLLVESLMFFSTTVLVKRLQPANGAT